ncbi:NifB/NifX family molybdenum-iron cluster-binding protein [Caldisphaera sp.]|uniref:NifB/NifX family molybdenum-iron cluster-binding protein n=1 Tax=Caldisphaera sp. TaxID=2060322 RepID=UPI003D142BB5
MDQGKIIKIAIPSDDGETMSDHFGRSLGFLVYHVDLSSNKVINKEFRKRSYAEDFHGHRKHHHGHENDNETSPEEARRHLDILNAIKDVDVIITAGMGPRMVSAFRSLNKTIIIAYDVDPDNLINEYIKQYIKT